MPPLSSSVTPSWKARSPVSDSSNLPISPSHSARFSTGASASSNRHYATATSSDFSTSGAFLVTLPFMVGRIGFDFPTLTSTQAYTLLYLGVLASGVCFFWWNLGATKVNAGTLAVFNNAKVPLGVACSLLFFGETADLPRLAVGGALLIAAVAVAETKPRPI
ncbi:MAG: EamA family transporter [Nibricoccus sp.]